MKALPTYSDLELENARLKSANSRLASLVRRWLALDAGAWNPPRHMRDKEELATLSSATLADVESRP